MAICHHFAPNGEKSVLYSQLETKYGEKQAHDVWTAIRTQQFINSHPWTTELLTPTGIPVDSNGEPTMEWVEQTLNLKVPESVVPKDKGTTTPIVQVIEENPITAPHLINRDEERIQLDRERIDIRKVDSTGKVVGFFSPEEHRMIVDSIVALTQKLLQNNPLIKGNALIKIMTGFKDAATKLTAERKDNFEYIDRERIRLAEDALRRLALLGWVIDDKTQKRILNGVKTYTMLGEQGKTVTQSDGTIAITQEDLDADDISEAAGHGLIDYSDSSFELDPKDTASARMKMFIANLSEVDASLQPIKNFLGFAKLVDFEATFEDALNVLADHKTGKFVDMMADLKASTKPQLQHLAAELEKQDEQMKNEFVKVMSKQYQEFTMMLFNRIKNKDTGKETYVLNAVNANRYSQTGTIIKNWQQAQKLSPIMITDGAGHRVIDVERARTKWMGNLKAAQVVKDWSDAKQVAPYKKFIKDMLSASGVTMTDEMMDYLFKNMEKLTKKAEGVSGGLQKQFSVTKDGKPSGIFSAFIMKMAGMSDEGDAEVDTALARQRAFKNNPLFTEQTTMNILARVAARFTPKLYSATHKSSEGKNVWDYGQNTKLSHKVRNMLNNFDEFVVAKSKSPIAKDNWLIQTLSGDKVKLGYIKLAYLDGLKGTWQTKGVTRQGMSDREQMLTSIGQFQNQGRVGANYISLTHSDKTTTPVMMNMPRLPAIKPQSVGFDTAGNAIVNPYIGTTGAPLYSVFKSEWNRITAHEKQVFNNKQYDNGKGLFYYFPEFNFDAMAAMVKDGTITQAEMNKIWVDGKRSLTRSINNDSELKVINKILTIVTNRRVDKLLGQWKAMGIINDKGSMLDKGYYKKQLKVLELKGGNDNIHAAALHYSVNYFMFNTNMSQLFYGDPALAWKGKPGQNDIKQVSATMKEYAKRLAKDIAPGQDGAWKEGEKSYQAITLSDVKPAESYLPESLLKAYSEVEGTDAQEITTVEEHLKVGYAYGTIPTKIYDEMVAIIKKAGPGGFYEFTVPEHKAIIMQPMKPVVAGSATDGILDDYVKSSSYPLYPPMVQGTEMDKLRNWMEKNGTARAAFISAVKLGAPTQTLSVFDKEGNFIEPTADSWKAATKTMSRDNFRIQQEVPYDEEKEAIKIVSQMNKLITEGISEITGFTLPGFDGTMTGAELRQVKETIRKEMIKLNADHFMEEMTAMYRDGQLTLKDKTKIYDVLAEEARKKGYTLNELQGLLTRDTDGSLAIPLMLNTAADRFESLLMSMVKKITEVKMPGKSYVQASSVGLKFTKEGAIDKSQVVWMGDYDGTALKTLRTENGVVKPAQVLLPFNFFDADGNKLKVEDYMTVDESGRKIIDHTKLPKELMQLVGARIPNQGHNSMLPIEIVGFIPDNMGDLVVVPAAITKQMGADFDVDKLYTYKRPYTIQDGTIAEQQRDSTKEGLQSRYFDVHWSVLTHPEMLEKVLRPLDKDDLKDENGILAPKEDVVDYFDVTNQLQDFQSGKDAKTLVGNTSLSVTFNSVIQNKELFYARQEFTDEGIEIQPDYVIVKDETTGKELKLGKLSGNGESTYNGERRTKHDNLTTMQSAAVDNAKERTLDNLNLTTNTYKAAAAFVQLEDKDGNAVNLKYVTRLLTQPIIREFDAMMKSGNDSLSDVFDKGLKESVFIKLQEKYAVDSAGIIFDPELLLKAQSMQGDEFKAHQLAALKLFIQLDTIGQRLTELQSLANGDTNGAGRRLIGSLDKADKMEKVNQVPIWGAKEIFAGTEQGVVFNSTVGIANDVISRLLPYDKLLPVFESIRKLTHKDRLGEDMRLSIIKGIRSFIYTEGQHWWSNPQGERVRLLYNHGTNKSLAQRLIAAKDSWGKDNYFLQRLSAEVGATVESPDFISYQAASVGTIDEEQNHRSWIDLLMSTDEEKRRLGEDLLRYTYLTGGVQDANSFVKFAPVSYIANTPFGKMLQQREKGFMEYKAGDENVDSITLNGFARQFIQHHPEAATQVAQEVFKDHIKGDQDYPESFPLQSSESGEFPAVLKGGDGIVPFISYYSKTEGKHILYQQQVIGENIWFTKIDTLGNNFSDEYTADVSAVRSIFAENRSQAVMVPKADAVTQIKQYLPDNPKDIMEETGIVLGGPEAIVQSVVNIANNPKVSGHLRGAAKIVGAIPVLTPNTNKMLGVHKEVKIELRIKKGNMGAASMNGTIYLNSEIHRTINELADTFVHELIHHKLQAVVIIAGFDNRIEGMLDAEIAAFQQKNPKVVQQLAALDNIRYRALTAARKKFGAAVVDKYYADLKSDPSTPTPAGYSTTLYALSSIQEFLAHVLTDHDFMKFLNETESTTKTPFLQQVLDLIVDILLELSSYYTSKINDNGLLKEALVHTLALTKPSTYGTITDGLSNNKIVVATEALANQLQTLGENTYGRKTTITDNISSYEVNITNEKKSVHAVPGQAGKLLDKLYSQLDDMGYALTTKSSKAERIAAGIRYQELKEDIAILSRDRNLDYIAEIGKRQLAWVDKILATERPSDNDVYTAIKTADIWAGLTELMYGDLTVEVLGNSEFDTLQSDAQKKRITLMNTKARKVVTDALGNRMTMNGMDFKEHLQELDYGTAYLLTLSRTKPKLLQGIAVLGRQAANNRDEEIARVTKRLQELESKMKANGISADQLIQNENWGLVQRLSGAWYRHIGELEEKRDMAIEGLEKGEKDEAKRKAGKSEAWNRYWNDIKKSVTFVNVTIFFNFTDGSKATGEKVDKAREKLAKEVGSEQYADELIEKAHQKYLQYIEEREIAKQHIATMGLTKEEESAEYEKWKMRNSPADFLSKMNSTASVKYLNSGNRWLVMVPKAANKEFYDEKYTAIQNGSAALQEVYQGYKDLISEMVSYLPESEGNKLNEDFLPIVSSETVRSLANIIGQVKNWDKAVLQSLTATDFEEQFRLKEDRIPIMYTRATKRTADIADRSTDLIRIAEVFAMMALHHKHMAPVADAINVAEAIVQEESRQRVNNNERGLRNALDAVKYFKDAIIYKKPTELEGKIDNAIYSLNPVTQLKTQKRVKELMIEKEQINKEVEESDELNFDEEDPKAKRLEEINKELDKYEREARHIYGSKVADTLIGINQMKALSYNPFSALSNFTFGLVSVSIHANARADYDNKSMRWAMGKMMNATKKYFTFGAANNGDAQKIHNLMDRTGIMGDVVDTQYGKSNLKTRKSKGVVEAVKPYNWQRSGDYYAKGVMMVAMLKHKQVEVNGTKMSLWDALDNEGKWNETEHGPAPTWYSADVSEQTEWNNFRDKVRKVGIIVFGNQDKNAPLMAKKQWLFRLAGQFRMSWFSEGIATRFMGERYDAELERTTKGRWVTYKDLGIVGSVVTLAKQAISALPGVDVDPFDGTTNKQGKALSDVDIENMRKNFAGLAWTVAFTASILLIRGLAIDDDKQGKRRSAERKKIQLLLNMLIRNQQDLMLYSSPSVFDTVTGNFLPATAVITDTLKAMKATGHYLANPEEKDAFDKWFRKQCRALPIANLYPKTSYMLGRDLDAITK